MRVLIRRESRVKAGKSPYTPEEQFQNALLVVKIILVFIFLVFICAFIGLKIFRIWGLIIGIIIGIVLSGMIANKLEEQQVRQDPLMRKIFQKLDI